MKNRHRVSQVVSKLICSRALAVNYGCLRRLRRIAASVAKLPELVRICAELSRAVLPGPSAIYPSVRLLLSARSSL